MVTTAEAFKSYDPNVVKRKRGLIGTQISYDASILENALSQILNNDFDFGKISLQLVKFRKTD